MFTTPAREASAVRMSENAYSRVGERHPQPRIQKREQTSADPWHLEVSLEKPAHRDRQVTTWLRAA